MDVLTRKMKFNPLEIDNNLCIFWQIHIATFITMARPRKSSSKQEHVAPIVEFPPLERMEVEEIVIS